MESNLRKIALFIIFILCLPFVCPAKIVQNKVYGLNVNSFKTEATAIIKDYSVFKDRIGGSDEEKQAANYIINYLDSETLFKPKTTSFYNNGVQNFSYYSQIMGYYLNSQNVVYELKSNKENAKKVIIGCNYDSPSYFNAESRAYESIGAEAINASSASVATLLLTAKYMSLQNLDFDIEIVFFGAGEDNFAGSLYYVNGIDDETVKNILCMINVDKIAVGKNLYFYENEINTSFSNYVSELFKNTESGIRQIDLVHLNKVEMATKYSLGLGYKHVAMNSDNFNFMSRGITTLNLFAGDYDEGVVEGLSEYLGSPVITYTENDNYDYILTNYGEERIENNVYAVYNSINTLLTDSDFILKANASIGETAVFYKIFANDNLTGFLTIIAFLIMICVAIFIHYKLTIKSYYSNIELEFLSSVVKITEQIDKNGMDKNVPKIVSQVIANDIKKDKTIRPEKKKDNKEDK